MVVQLPLAIDERIQLGKEAKEDYPREQLECQPELHPSPSYLSRCVRVVATVFFFLSLFLFFLSVQLPTLVRRFRLRVTFFVPRSFGVPITVHEERRSKRTK